MRCSAHILNLIVKDGLDVLKDGIERIRETVLFWTCTPKRVEFFEDTAKQLRVVVQKKLVLDCPTRWNSTYKMLEVAIPYKDVFTRLKARDFQYKSVPSANDWEFASVVCDKLSIFNEITDVFSGANYPTAHQFFPRVCKLRLKIMEWCVDPNQIIVAMAERMWHKFAKYWNDIHDFDLYVSQRKRSRTTLVTTELDHYLADDLHPRSSKFDILNWWSVNGAKYPTLQQIARDFLAVPITSVASEFAFSAGGRLLDPHRSRLHHSTVEAMMCARSWIRDEMK
ncbi:Zinc finger BED domain-containing protein RICESLEEPER 2 [Linum grandiflorum]